MLLKTRTTASTADRSTKLIAGLASIRTGLESMPPNPAQYDRTEIDAYSALLREAIGNPISQDASEKLLEFLSWVATEVFRRLTPNDAALSVDAIRATERLLHPLFDLSLHAVGGEQEVVKVYVWVGRVMRDSCTFICTGITLDGESADLASKVARQVETEYEAVKTLRSCLDSITTSWHKAKKLAAEGTMKATIESFFTEVVARKEADLKQLVEAICTKSKEPLLALHWDIGHKSGGGTEGRSWWDELPAEVQTNTKTFAQLLLVETATNFPAKEMLAASKQLTEVVWENE